MGIIKNFLFKIIYKERATQKSYKRYLKNNCLNFGDNVYFTNPHKTYIDDGALPFISIGSNVQILSGVTILAHDESYSVCGPLYKKLPRAQYFTHIGDNVFIGMNTTVLMGSYIGDNVIIGAGSVVSGKLDSNFVYAGCPAKKIESIEEYYNKHMENFEKSAFFYIKRFQEVNGRYPNLNEIHVYALLINGGVIPEAPNKSKEMVNKINSENTAKYHSVEDFVAINNLKYLNLYLKEKKKHE